MRSKLIFRVARGNGKPYQTFELAYRYLFYTTIPHKNYNQAMEMRLNGFFWLKGEER